MILLLGGTGATAEIAEGLAEAGYRVLVSLATEVPLEIGDHPAITVRRGPLEEDSLAELLAEREIRAVVDATHPYATTIRATARRIAERMGLPYLSFLRPGVVEAENAGVEFAQDHAAAACLAFSYGRAVLLTTGSRNLSPYVQAARRTGLPLVVRVLDHAESRAACRQAGIPDQCVLVGRGPFSIEENRAHIRRFDIGVLVTKDSGRQGGVLEKLDAARAEHCRLVVVRRPEADQTWTFSEFAPLLQALGERCGTI